MTNEISTKFADDYKIKIPPKNMKIEIGETYILCDGGGNTKHVTIVSLRKLNDLVMVYYKYRRGSSSSKIMDFLTGGSWIHCNCTLSQFKLQLLSFGQVNEVELIYNDEPNLTVNED
jgi:hypothetical protein